MPTVICGHRFILLCSCVTTPRIDSFKRPEIDFRIYNPIAVWTFTCPIENPAIGGEIADIVAIELLKKGYNVIERNQIEIVLKEQGLILSGALKSTDIIQIGNIFNVFGIITGNVAEYKSDKRIAYLPYQGTTLPIQKTRSTFSVTMKMLDIETGKLLWSSTGSQRGRNCLPSTLAKSTIKRCLRDIPPLNVNK